MTAKQLKEIRSKSGLSQRAFADAGQVSKRTLQDWEQGRRNMSSMSEKWLRHNLAVYQDLLFRAKKLKRVFL